VLLVLQQMKGVIAPHYVSMVHLRVTQRGANLEGALDGGATLSLPLDSVVNIYEIPGKVDQGNEERWIR